MPHRKRIVVCIDAHPKVNVLLRAAANKAAELGTQWIALYVETPNHFATDRESRARILRFLTNAENMGGSVEHVEARDVLQGITGYIKASFERNHPITHVIMGQNTKEGFFAELRSTLAERVTRALRQYSTEVQIIPLSSHHYTSSWFDRLKLREISLKENAIALFYVLVAYGCAEILRSSLTNDSWSINEHNIMAFFLIATIAASLRYGLIPGLLSAITGYSTINYFYTAPFRSFELTSSADGISLSIFLLSAVVVSFAGAYSRAANSALIRKERRSQALYKIHRLASNANTQQKALEILHEELSDLLEMDVAFFLPKAMNPEEIALAYPKTMVFGENDLGSLAVCWEKVRTSGLGTINRFDSSWRFEPMLTSHEELGVMAIKVPPHIRIDASFGRLLSALADQSASILERIELTKMMGESHVREEREKLRAMLLSSVSHDLKTPLASIIGSLSVYLRMKKSGRLDSDTADELTATALEEARRLDSFISNILDMTRIESGEIVFDQEWADSSEPVHNIEKRLNYRLAQNEFVFVPLDEAHQVLMDQMMTEQVLQNVVDNAIKYSPKHSKITVSCHIDDAGFSYKVRDSGPGIPDEKRDAIFDKYERLKQSDSQVAGTGLGLAISQAIMDKQGGAITVSNHPDGGALFTIVLPQYKHSSAERSRAV